MSNYIGSWIKLCEMSLNVGTSTKKETKKKLRDEGKSHTTANEEIQAIIQLKCLLLRQRVERRVSEGIADFLPRFGHMALKSMPAGKQLC